MRQRGHMKAPGSWINDPDGFIYYKGNYHLFYQYFPWEPQWGTMHWGHAISKDLVNWEHKGVALFPTKYEDQNGCFSGSAVEHDGRMYIYYTGVHYNVVNPENIHHCLNSQFESCQMMIVSEDGMHFDNINQKKVIIPPLEDSKMGDRAHTRDPKVWRGKDAWYMVLGSTSEEKGKLLFYRSENLTDWTLINQVTKDEGLGWMWECPDYFEIDGEKVLIFSPMGLLKDGKSTEDMTICTTVDFEEETCTMEIPDDYQFMDYGLDLYAPQSTLDEEGNRVLIAWLRMPEAVNGKWRGMMCLPRAIEVKDGHIYFRPHPNVKKLYSRKIARVEEADKDGYRISLELKNGESINIGGYRISRKENHICTDRNSVCPGHDKCRMEFETPVIKEGYHLDIYVDANMIEVFVNDGEYVISNAVCTMKNEILSDAAGEIELYTLTEQEN